MKILCLSDLHQRMADISDVIHQKHFTPFLQSIRDLAGDTQPDVAVVTGDTVPTPYVSSLNAFFGILFFEDITFGYRAGNLPTNTYIIYRFGCLLLCMLAISKILWKRISSSLPSGKGGRLDVKRKE